VKVFKNYRGLKHPSQPKELKMETEQQYVDSVTERLAILIDNNFSTDKELSCLPLAFSGLLIGTCIENSIPKEELMGHLNSLWDLLVIELELENNIH